MSNSSSTGSETTDFYALVTGSNSGLGYAICCRLIDQFLLTRPQSENLVLVITTRSKSKSDDTLSRLRAHLQKECRKAEASLPGVHALLERRVRFHPEQLDLTSISSVQACAQRLLQAIPKLDAIFLNAGMGAFTGVSWPTAIWTVITDMPHSLTFPTFKIAEAGRVTEQGSKENKVRKVEGEMDSSQAIGEVFCANVFGHYVLVHSLSPLLRAAGASGRIIWMSSLEAYARTFSLDDLQGIGTSVPYESSKRLTDILALTYDSPAVKPWSDRFLGSSEGDASTRRPKMYLAHPGVCASAIFPLPWILLLCMEAAFYLARWVGSQWHPVDVYKGAVAPVWLALTSQEELDHIESEEGKGKWGSATDRWGRERVERTEVEGFGWTGRVGEPVREKGRWRHAKQLTEQDREDFEETGRKCWQAMEALREEWTRRLARE